MKIRGILIDPEKRTIEEVDVTMRTVDEGGAASIRQHIKADLFDTVRLGRNHVIWCDDEGLLKPPPHFFFADLELRRILWATNLCLWMIILKWLWR